MTVHDDFILGEITPMLEPGEEIINKAFMVKQPGLFWQLILLGGLLLFLMTKAFYVVATNKRIIMVKTKLGFFKPKLLSLGTDEMSLENITKVTTSGIANNRSMTFHMTDGSKDTLRIAPWSKIVTGQKAFLEEVPKRVGTEALTS